MNFGHELARFGCDNGERPDPNTGCRFVPVLPQASNPEWRAVLYGNGNGCFARFTPDDQ
jgi:hypothetical protein